MGKPITKPDQGKQADGFYETFDSGEGPMVPEREKGNFEHRDSDLMANGEDTEHGAIPYSPKKSGRSK